MGDKYQNFNIKRNDDQILYGEASKRTKEFLQSTKEMRLKIEKQLETLDDCDSRHMEAMTNSLEQRIKQCDETLENLLSLKDRLLRRPVLSRENIESMRAELPFPKELYQIDPYESEFNDNSSYDSTALGSNSIFPMLEESRRGFPSRSHNNANDLIREITHYNPLPTLENLRNLSAPSYSSAHLRDYQDDDDDDYPHVTGFTKYPENQTASNNQSGETANGLTKFCANIRDFQYILEQNANEREQQMNRVADFFRDVSPTAPESHLPAGGEELPQTSQPQAYATSKPQPFHSPPGHPVYQPNMQPDLKPRYQPYYMLPQPPANQSNTWDAYTVSNTDMKKPPQPNPICCGPSKLRPIFDSKIQKLEQQIIKFCFEIKEKNILIEQCCRAKEVLLCQKQNLHAILLRLCEKIRQLEKKLYRIKMAVCCPNFPIQECSTSTSCTEEIKNLKKLEEKLETLYNGAKHKECLLEICKRSVNVLEQDKLEWQQNIKEMEKIRKELQKQLEDMKQKVCRKAQPDIPVRKHPLTIPEKDSTVQDSDLSSNLDEYLSLDYSEKQPPKRKPQYSAPSANTETEPYSDAGKIPARTTHKCLKECRCRRR